MIGARESTDPPKALPPKSVTRFAVGSADGSSLMKVLRGKRREYKRKKKKGDYHILQTHQVKKGLVTSDTFLGPRSLNRDLQSDRRMANQCHSF